ncbi:hypothetical protein [Adhaeribacter pallidiroseus]|uniref:Uncharacterized protein n=1 Tax=Adhaeribacter pallidiroseus TaxID=2072847 RepID=A0A369QT08_9BACT|nr:hypothetical protein [Adhaeribacter pallidiroseus]RDC65298.1 hypothetical protein AHMF7616_03928 [Adhaeribacter pallidiroseus]
MVNQNVRDSPITLKATSTSGLPVSFSVVSGPATIKNNQLTLTGTRMVTIKAFQAGDATYGPAAVSQRFLVYNSPVSQVWNKTYGGVVTDENPDSPCVEEYQDLYGASTLRAMVRTPDGGYLLGAPLIPGKETTKVLLTGECLPMVVMGRMLSKITG